MKKKTLLATILASALFASAAFTGCGSTANNPAADTKTENIETTEKVEPNNETEAKASNVAEALDVDNLSDEQSQMLAIMDSLNMCLCEGDLVYEPTDETFFWEALIYTIGNYNNLGNNVELALVKTDGVMSVDKNLVQAYATGLFYDYNGLLDLPDDCRVSINPEDDCYYDFPLGDRGLSYGKIVSWKVNPDGSNTVVTELISSDTEEVMCTGIYTLVDNPHLSEDAPLTFAYSVKDMHLEQ